MAYKKATPEHKLIKKYIKKAKLLKQHRLIDYDLRKTLTPARKAAITRLWKGKKKDDDSHYDGWGQYIDNKNVIFRTVSNKRLKELKALGYKTHGNRVYIDSEGYDEIHIKGKHVIKKKKGKKQTDLLVPRGEILNTLERLTKKKLPKGQFVTVRIGDYSPFKTVLKSYESLLNYVSNWKPRKEFDARDDLIGQMSIVEIEQ